MTIKWSESIQIYTPKQYLFVIPYDKKRSITLTKMSHVGESGHAQPSSLHKRLNTPPLIHNDIPHTGKCKCTGGYYNKLVLA